MIITNHGLGFFKIQHGDTVLALNPVSKKSKSGVKSTSFGSDIAFVTTWHDDFNGVDSVSRKEKQSFIIKGPGEYEVKELFVRGFPSKSHYDGKERNNTIYMFTIDSITVGFLGAISDKELSPDVKEVMGNVDILFVPVSGEDTLTPSDAYKLAVKREPHIIIPMLYDKKTLDDFVKEGGEEKADTVEKLTLKKKDVESKQGEIIVVKESK